jgi:HAD superfamily hydrolase (TIGR01509 family)
MISTIIFDLGNVFVKINNQRTIPIFTSYLTDKKDERELERILYYGYIEPDNETEKFFQDVHQKFNRGILKSHDLYVNITKHLSLSPDFTYDRFLMIWPARFERIESTITVLKKLNKYQRFLLSDTNELDITYIMKHHSDIFHEFDQVFFSHITKIGKKSERAWQNILKQSQNHPNTYLFIDDRKEYVERAEKLGMKGIVYTNTENLIKDLNNAGCKF